MKLRHKFLLTVGLLWILFFVLPITLLPNLELRSIYPFILLGIAFSTIMIWLLRIFILQRLEKLDNDVTEITEKRLFSTHIDVNNHDELASITLKINAIIDIIQSLQDQMEHMIEKRIETLQNANIQLQQEITERKLIEEELVNHKKHLGRLAHYDYLTSLPNRVFFNEILNKAIHHASRHEKLLAVLFVDLDRF